MRRTFLPTLTIALLAAMTITTSPAEAAATCSIHSGAIVHWSEQNDTIGFNGDFQCGGAENTRFRVKATLQQDFGGWLEANCVNTCHTWRPSSSTWYAEGTEHAFTGNFALAGNIDGWDFRMRYDVSFANGDPTQTWYSNRQTV